MRNKLLSASLLRTLFVGLCLTGLVACGGSDYTAVSEPPPANPPTPVTPPAPPPPVSMVIGPAGGVLIGPDGVQLVVPAGALEENVTLRIARSGEGAPPLPEDIYSTPVIYEITPHDLRFARPVQVWLPLNGAAADSALAMAADSGGNWATVPASFEGGYAVVERQTLSWFWSSSNLSIVCSIPRDNTDPYPCTMASLGGSITADPPSALVTQGNPVTRVLRQAATLNVQMTFAAARDCTAPTITVVRTDRPGGIGPWLPAQTVLSSSVTLTPVGQTTSAAGNVLVPLQFTGPSKGLVSLRFDFSCTRRFRNYQSFATAHVWLNVDIPPVTSVTTGSFLMAGEPGVTGSADGTAGAARFNQPNYIARNPASGTLYVGDFSNNTIRAITSSGAVTTLAGTAPLAGYVDATGPAARFRGNGGLGVDASGNVLVSDWDNHAIRRITPGGVVSTLAGNGTSGSANGNGTAARFTNPNGLAIDGSGNVYVADWANHTIRRITPAGDVTTLAGAPGLRGSADGTGLAARFNLPSGVAVDAGGNVYVADQANHVIRRITAGGVVTTFAGLAGSPGTVDGTGTSARFTNPAWLSVSPSGDVFVVSGAGDTVRKITPAGVVTTVVGVAGYVGPVVLGSNANTRLRNARGVLAVSSNELYVAADHAVLRVTLP